MKKKRKRNFLLFDNTCWNFFNIIYQYYLMFSPFYISKKYKYKASRFDWVINQPTSQNWVSSLVLETSSINNLITKRTQLILNEKEKTQRFSNRNYKNQKKSLLIYAIKYSIPLASMIQHMTMNWVAFFFYRVWSTSCNERRVACAVL